MTDLRMYELEDTDWDEFCRSEDHIVPPHPGFERAGNHPVRGDSNKKPRREVTSRTEDRSAPRYVFQGTAQGRSSNLSESSKMLERDSLPNTPSGVLPSSSGSDSIKEASSLTSDNIRSSGQGFKSNGKGSNGSELCADDTIISDKTTIADNNSFSYPLDGMMHTGNNLDFLENSEDKDSNDFLYYNWPEIGNFEDVDRMFRSCDSTFGLGASKEDELGWFSSADDIGGTDDVLKSDSKFPSPESKSVLNNIGNLDTSNNYTANDYAMAAGAVRYMDCSWTSEIADPCVSFEKGPVMADTKDGIVPNKQINERRDQFKLQNQHMGGMENQYNGTGSFSYISSVSNEVMQLSSGATSHQPSPSVCMQQQQQTSGPNYVYSQDPVSYGHSDYCHSSDRDLVNQITSSIKPEVDGLRSLSQKSSHLSSQLTALAESEKREKLQNCQGSSDIQGSSTSGLGGTSLEAAGFRQLQLVMEQLDLRTKLCIRDSLYRLARSAEDRHNHESLDGGYDQRDATGALMTERTKKFMDIETDTNPIDRSIAHLLFHRPLESSAIPTQDRSQYVSPTVVKGSVTRMPAMVENFISCEETACEMASEQ